MYGLMLKFVRIENNDFMNFYFICIDNKLQIGES